MELIQFPCAADQTIHPKTNFQLSTWTAVSAWSPQKLSLNSLHPEKLFMISCCLLIFFQTNFYKKNLTAIPSGCQKDWIQIRARHFVWPDLGPNCLQRLSAVGITCKNLNETMIDYSHIYIMFLLYLDSVSLSLHTMSKTLSPFQYDNTNMQAVLMNQDRGVSIQPWKNRNIH